MDKMKSYFKIMLVAGVIFGIFFGLGGIIGSVFAPKDADIAEQPTIQDGERTNILFLGVDERTGETQSRSDTIILASIDPELNKIALVSIPRDTRVEITGYGTNKICIANYAGGPEMAMEKVENLIGENIDYYVEMNFNGFEKIVDTLGGVSLKVEQRMYKPSEGIDLHPGEQRLDGYDALAFVRYRGYVMGDIDRTTHQQTFLKALAKETLQPKTITKLPQLIKQANQYVKTNLSITDMLKIASWAPGFDEESVIAQTLPGYFYDERNADGVLTQSFWIADSSQQNRLLDKMFNGQTVAVLTGSQNETHTTTYDTTNDTNLDSNNKPETQIKKNTSANRVDLNDEDINLERSRLPSPGHETV